MKKFNVYGEIVDSDSMKSDQNDLTLKDFTKFIDGLEDNDQVEFVFNSPGGSVASGIAISNKIKALANRGIKTTAKVEGICASISTCIACACDKIILGKGSFFMIHNCWGVVQGDCNTLRKEADLMEKMNSAILSFYRSKFKATDEQLKQWMDQETWISSEDYTNFGLICEVEDFGTSYPIAASLKKFNFKNMPKKFDSVIKSIESDNIMEKEIEEIEKTEEEKKEVEEVEKTEQTSETPETPSEEKTEEEKKEDDPMSSEEFMESEEDETKPTYEELEKKCAELEEEVEKLRKELEEPTDKRVSGMQAKMQLKINDCEHKYKDLIEVKDKEIKLRDEELESIKAEATSLKAKLDESMKNCGDLASALRDKDSALESLNARVLGPSDPATKKSWRDLEGKEFFDYLKKNNNIIKITK